MNLAGEIPVSQPGQRILVYGLLRCGQSGHNLLAEAIFESRYRLPGFEMVTAGPYPFAVVGEPAHSIVVEQYVISPHLLNRLDLYEDFHGVGFTDNLYDRIRVMAPSGIRAWIYIISARTRAKRGTNLIRVEGGDWISHHS
jgi:gamma-glutamylcyclotransferase (GGCT)/AIG2-like uncharacterized protein YtfP